MPKKFFPPFRVGDVVKYIGKDRVWGKESEHIIQDVSVNGINYYEYSTDRGAWIPHEDFELVRECDKASLTKLLKSMSDEYDQDYKEL